ncbi:MAG TPA: hypothetical protein VK425_10445 [Acidimicrobiales bacterium]|nr:hypothetical protein [Acidimicrobiales bacterium]
MVTALVVVTVGQGVAHPSTEGVPANSGPPSTAAGLPSMTVYDPGLHVMWLADADLAATDTFGTADIDADGSMTYATAVKWVYAMNHSDNGKGYLGHNDWTLPVTPTPDTDTTCSSNNNSGGGHFGFGCTVSPLASLYKTLGLSWPNTAVVVPGSTTGPFHDFQPYIYWSRTWAGTYANNFSTLSFNTGRPMANISLHYMYVLPMLPGNPFDATASSVLVPVDKGQAVYEAGTGTHGVTWLADADLAKSQTFGIAGPVNVDGSMEHSTAVDDWVPAMSTRRWLGKTGWRLPTQDELEALYNALGLSAQHPVVPVPSTMLGGFGDIQPYLYWSCAGQSVVGTCQGQPGSGQQWSFSFGNGYQGTDVTENLLYVMVYYPYYPAPSPTTRPTVPPCRPVSGQPGKCV